MTLYVFTLFLGPAVDFFFFTVVRITCLSWKNSFGFALSWFRILFSVRSMPRLVCFGSSWIGLMAMVLARGGCCCSLTVIRFESLCLWPWRIWSWFSRLDMPILFTRSRFLWIFSFKLASSSATFALKGHRAPMS